ncbi:MAG: hypothetical protein GF328_09420 [Candidatus Latescibacteria bacterium]|nr:hypothetical protein [Candidatus Latescibacterota bacterium]
MEIHDARIGAEGGPIFIDREGQVIAGARPIIPPRLVKESVAQKFMVNDTPFFLNVEGGVIDVEQGQAGGSQVLMAQNGSLVYFRASVNDVFAYFITGLLHGEIPFPGDDFTSAQFPTTGDDLTPIVEFAESHDKTLVDTEALAIEVKTSWIEAHLLDDPERYITLMGTIPTYDASDPDLWVHTGNKTIELAMVGMHVVGSTKGHPEMIWATFEHVSSTPNAEYSYTKESGSTTTVPQQTSGQWLFCEDGSDGPFNVPHMQMDSGSHDIESVGEHTISPSNTIRWKAWGQAHPNPGSNAEVIAINNSIRSKLAEDDVRRNYIMTGATWTISGAPPNSGNQVGTRLLANTTMETYQQGSDNGNNGTNCFSCHTTNELPVSAIAPRMEPLF